METTQKAVNYLANEDTFPLKASSLSQDEWCYLEIYNKTHYTEYILQHTCFNLACYTCSYLKWV